MFETFFSDLALPLLADSALAQSVLNAAASVDVLPDGVVQLLTYANSAGVLTAGQEYRR